MDWTDPTDWADAVDWWDAVELWLTQQWLPLQLAVLMVVLLPSCWWVALLIDRGVDTVSEWLCRRIDIQGSQDSP